MMKSEFLERLRSVPGHEADDISAENYSRVEFVYTFHPAIPDVGGKDVIANLYAYGGMLVIADMYTRAKKALDAGAKIAEIRHDIDELEEQIATIMAEVMK